MVNVRSIIDTDLGTGKYVQPVSGVYVRQELEPVAQPIHVHATGTTSVRVPFLLQQVITAEPETVFYGRFMGTVGSVGMTTVINGQRYVVSRMYVRPLKEYTEVVLRAMNLASELSRRAYVWTAIVIGYPSTKKKVRVLVPRTIHMFWQRYRTKSTSEPRVTPVLRMYFYQDYIAGFKKRTPYPFDIAILIARNITVPLKVTAPATSTVAQPVPNELNTEDRQINAGGTGEFVREVKFVTEAGTGKAKPEQRPSEAEAVQSVSRLLGGELTPEEIQRTIKQLQESERKVKLYLDW